MSLLASLHSWGNFAPTLPRPILATQGWANPRSARSDIHRGMDLRAAIGTPVYAALSGVVLVADAGSPTAGNWIAIKHADGLITRYLHLSKISVRVGQPVGRGQQIGLSGNTGNSAGPHLHADALVPRALLPTYQSLFGTPKSGFTSSGLFADSVKVPLEPLYVVDSYQDDVKAGAQAQGLKLRGGNSPLLLVAGLAVAGWIGWRWYTDRPIIPRLGPA